MSEATYAVLECSGGQMKVCEGDTILLDKGEVGKEIELGPVLALRSTSGLNVGKPYVEGAKVTGIVEEAVKGRKIIVAKFKRRKGYKLRKGHRQKYVSVRVTAIVAGKTKKKTAAKKKKKED